MNINLFQLLDRKRQMKTIWEQGVLIGKRSTIFCSIELYQIEGFYAEVFYEKEEHIFILLKSFDTTDQLTPYLNQIRIFVDTLY